MTRLYSYVKTINNSFFSVLYIHFGTPAVEKFIENAVMEIASNELGEARVKLTNESNAVSQFHELVHKEGGTMEAQPLEAADKQWQMKIVAKLRPTAVLFSHARTASSKQKAKLAACQDVLKFLSDCKDVFDQLQLVNISSTDVHPLPIEVADYTKIVEPARSTITTKSTTYSAADVTESNESVHIPFFHGEDAIRQLSRLLLGDSGSDISDDSSMSEGSPTKKRMRDVEQQVKQSQKQPQQPTGVKSMFGSAYYATTPPLSAVSPTPPTPKASTTTATATAASIKPEPLTKTDPVELEAVNQNLLNSLSNPTSSPSTTRPSTQSATSSMDSLKTAPTSPLNNNVQQQPTTSTASEGGADMMEADDDEPSNPFTSIATATSTAICQQEIDPRIISYYKKIFGPHRSAMLQAMNMPGQCKSIFLSLTQQNTDKLIVESKTAQVGPPHAPVFSVVVILRSREYAVCTVKTEAIARRKKDAEMHAFHKLVCMMK